MLIASILMKIFRYFLKNIAISKYFPLSPKGSWKSFETLRQRQCGLLTEYINSGIIYDRDYGKQLIKTILGR